MSNVVTFTTAIENDILDAAFDSCDAGSQAGRLRLYDGAVLTTTYVLSDPAWAPAASGSKVLNEVAEVLETMVSQTFDLMNQGASLNDIIHSVKVSPDLLAKPYLAPTYDEPEFVVRNIWRLYGGWYDGNPAQLKPARDALVAAELAKLSGGALKLAERARLLAETDPRLACHLVEFAVHAEPENKAVHQVRAEVYQYRRTTETSLMAKGIFGSAANQSRQISENE